jgi:hypothetical protein
MILSYQGHNIEQRDVDGYVNLTQMAKLFNKRVSNWSNTENAKAYLEATSTVTGICVTELLLQTKGGQIEDQGSWAHPLVAIEFAHWLDPFLFLFIASKGSFGLNNDLFSKKPFKDKSGFVYLIKASKTGFFKIGISKDCYQRLKTLQTGSPFELVVIDRLFTINAPQLEKSLHDYYRAYSIQGEWFKFDFDIASEFYNVASELDKAAEVNTNLLTN